MGTQLGTKSFIFLALAAGLLLLWSKVGTDRLRDMVIRSLSASEYSRYLKSQT